MSAVGGGGGKGQAKEVLQFVETKGFAGSLSGLWQVTNGPCKGSEEKG